jgi:Ca-activated chloride channel family protein
MRLLRSTLLASLVALLVASSLHRDGPIGLQPVHAQQSGVISGRVVNLQGQGLPHVAVDLLRMTSVVQSTTTDTRGEFRFVDVIPGVYEVRAGAAGLEPASIRVALAGGLAPPPLRLSLGVPAAAAAANQAAARGGSGAGTGGGILGGFVGGLVEAPPPAAAPVPATQGVGRALGPRADAIRPTFNREAYGKIDDNPFRRVAVEPVSTFSTDVDTASYANVRRFLNDGRLPPPDAVRVEEFVNYFRFANPDPRGDAPVSVTTEIAPCPWAPTHTLALIGLQAKRQSTEVPARNLVFLLDVSGSMTPADKLPLVKTAMRMLVDTLTARDRVAIVIYAGASGMALPSTSGDRKADIHAAIDQLRPGGSTNGAAGIQLAYDTAASAFVKGGVNRVILATDGDFNVGVTSQGDLVRLIEEQRARGIFLSVLGVGTGNLQDSTMELLADKGNGNYSYLDSLQEARRVLIDEANATLITVAKDVKVQVEFNPRTVGAYRLVGYENRLLAREDFNDDRKDAGELGAGHTVTALYELIPPGEPLPGVTVDPLVYQNAPAPNASSRSNDLMTVKVRYKAPDEDASRLLTVAVRADAGGRPRHIGFAAAVAQFGMLLRDSAFKGEATWSSTSALARAARGDDPDGFRAELIRLIDLAAALNAQQ